MHCFSSRFAAISAYPRRRFSAGGWGRKDNDKTMGWTDRCKLTCSGTCGSDYGGCVNKASQSFSIRQPSAIIVPTNAPPPSNDGHLQSNISVNQFEVSYVFFHHARIRTKLFIQILILYAINQWISAWRSCVYMPAV